MTFWMTNMATVFDDDHIDGKMAFYFNDKDYNNFDGQYDNFYG